MISVVIVNELEKILKEARKPGANIACLQQTIIEAKNPWYAYWFARETKNVNVPALQDVVIAAHDPYVAFYFARSVEGADIEKLRPIFRDTGYQL